MAAIAYNLKKYLKFEKKNTQIISGELKQAILSPNQLFSILYATILGLLSLYIRSSDKNNLNLKSYMHRINLKIY